MVNKLQKPIPIDVDFYRRTSKNKSLIGDTFPEMYSFWGGGKILPYFLDIRFLTLRSSRKNTNYECRKSPRWQGFRPLEMTGFSFLVLGLLVVRSSDSCDKCSSTTATKPSFLLRKASHNTLLRKSRTL